LDGEFRVNVMKSSQTFSKSMQNIILMSIFKCFTANSLKDLHIIASHSFRALMKRIFLRSFYVLCILLPLLYIC